jgi:formylmethanofuran dehydrogenase subunit E
VRARPLAPTLALLAALALAGCAARTSKAHHDEPALAEVAAIHGGAGPWVVAGYRMARYALARLGLPKQSFDLEVTHKSPRQVQYSCIADGASAATGASLGKLNLSLVEVPAAELVTIYRRRSTGAEVRLRPTRAFAARFTNVPRPELGKAGRAVLALSDGEIFEEVPVEPMPSSSPQ